MLVLLLHGTLTQEEAELPSDLGHEARYGDGVELLHVLVLQMHPHDSSIP